MLQDEIRSQNYWKTLMKNSLPLRLQASSLHPSKNKPTRRHLPGILNANFKTPSFQGTCQGLFLNMINITILKLYLDKFNNFMAINRYDLLVHHLRNCNLKTCHVTCSCAFAIALLTICTTQSLEYVLSIRPLLFSPGNETLSCYLWESNFHLRIYCAISPDVLMFYRCFSNLFYGQGLFCVFSIKKSCYCLFWGVFWFSYSMTRFNIFTWCIYIYLI